MTPTSAIVVGSDAERREPIVSHSPDLIVFDAEQHIYGVRHPHREPARLTNPYQTREKLLGRNGYIAFGPRFETIVARPAWDSIERLAKICQQSGAPAPIGVCVAF